LGNLDSLQKNKAEESIRKGIEILESLKLKAPYSCGYLFLGELYAYSDQQKKSMEYLKKAEENFREMEMDYWFEKTQEVLKKL
jgi:hypothetical protein